MFVFPLLYLPSPLPRQVILVTNETAKEKMPEELELALVLTVYEAKGLEFDDVLLYNFFTDSEVRPTELFSHDCVDELPFRSREENWELSRCELITGA